METPTALESTDATTAPASVESVTAIVALREPARTTTSAPVMVERRTSANACGPRSVTLPATKLSSRRSVVPAESDVTSRVPEARSITRVTLSAVTVSCMSAHPTAWVSTVTGPSAGHGSQAASAAASDSASRRSPGDMARRKCECNVILAFYLARARDVVLTPSSLLSVKERGTRTLISAR